ncbi:hypothetical protein [Streptomyces goshikiensis]
MGVPAALIALWRGGRRRAAPVPGGLERLRGLLDRNLSRAG